MAALYALECRKIHDEPHFLVGLVCVFLWPLVITYILIAALEGKL